MSLGSLPRRKSHSPTSTQGRKSPAFHIHGDDDLDDRCLSSSDSLDEQTSIRSDNPKSSTKNSQGALQLPPAVPFPRRSPSPSSLIHGPFSPPITSPRPQPSRGSSTAILLPNGKPLKSSLKSSTSTLSIPTPPLESQRPNNHLHLRSRSEPSTPTSHAPKNVHFPDTDIGLASVRIFSRSARPTAVSTPEGDETETEGEDQPSTGFPFPKFPSPMPNYEMDTATSSVVPVTNPPPHANILMESLTFSHASSKGVNPHLSGTLLVRNLAYEKHVAVRFTLDEWQTVSEVRAQYVVSVPSLPSVFGSSSSSRTTVGDLIARGADNRGWDRFSFIIRLEDYAHCLGSRVLWLAARYRVHSIYPGLSTEIAGPGGEWWDNNNGGNYRIAFRAARQTSSRIRRETAPEPILPSMVTLPTSREHAPAPPLSFNSSSTFGKKMLFSSSSPPRDSKEKVSLPLRSGKLRLPNYAAPPVVSPVSPTSSASSVPAQRSNSPSSPSSSPQLPTLQVPVPQSRDYDSSSPASSTLSTPSASPNIAPCVIIGGQLANYARPQQTHIDDWEWMAQSTQAVMSKRSTARRSVTDEPVGLTGSGAPGLPPRAHSSSGTPGPPGSDDLSGDSLYNAFVTRWCFAQGSSTAGPYHGPHTGGDEGILA